MKGIVIGGGIAGLTMAIALQQAGCEVAVYESATEIKPVGAGISMAPNAMTVLHRLGISKSIEAVGMPMDNLTVTDEHFKPIQLMPQAPIRQQYGFVTTNLHRAALHQVLLEQLPAGAVHLGKRFTHAEEHAGKVTAHFEDGSSATDDFLIGADGIHSKVRQQLWPNIAYRYSGQTSWRGVVQFNLPEEYQTTSIEAFGGANRFGFTAIGSGLVYWYAAAIAPANSPVPQAQTKAHLTGRFKNFAPLVNQLINATADTQIVQTDINDFVTPTQWHQGNICLIGDAAHAMTPNMGQGGCQAIEDAWFLAEALKQHTEPEKAFAAFTKQRLPKVKFIVANSYQFGKIAHLQTGRRFFYWLMRNLPARVSQKQMEKVYRV